MFGFGNKPSKREKLIGELNKSIDTNVRLVIKDAPVEDLQGTFILISLNSFKKSADENVYGISQQFEIPQSEVLEIIRSCYIAAIEKYITY